MATRMRLSLSLLLPLYLWVCRAFNTTQCGPKWILKYTQQQQKYDKIIQHEPQSGNTCPLYKSEETLCGSLIAKSCRLLAVKCRLKFTVTCFFTNLITTFSNEPWTAHRSSYAWHQLKIICLNVRIIASHVES